MILIEQPNRWSCAVASLAMLLDVTVSELVTIIGHDGSEILFPDLPEPSRRKGFPISDLVDVAWVLGYGLVQIDVVPMIQSVNGELESLYLEEYNEKRLYRYIYNTSGLALGQYSLDRWHMVAFEQGIIHDPTGPRKYDFKDQSVETLTIDTLWLKSKV